MTVNVSARTQTRTLTTRSRRSLSIINDVLTVFFTYISKFKIRNVLARTLRTLLWKDISLFGMSNPHVSFINKNK